MTINNLRQITDFLFVSDHGHYIYDNNRDWVFVAKEKQYSSNDLLDISNILNVLNDKNEKTKS